MRAVIAAALAAAACGGGRSQPQLLGQTCAKYQDDQCASDYCGGVTFAALNSDGGWSGEVTSFNLCVVPCESGCPIGTFCFSQVGRYCYQSCATDADCPSASVCDPRVGSGGCVPSCSTQPTLCERAASCLPSGRCSNWVAISAASD